MRTIVVALAVALVTASSSTAAFVVTSKNIRNGTIQLVDISPKAKKALRGQRGPRGTVDEITQVASPVTVPPGTSTSAQATCPAGQQPISGGFSSSGAIAISVSAADVDRRAWFVAAANPSATPQGLTAIAYCAKGVTILRP
jgi:hypothetical protein